MATRLCLLAAAAPPLLLACAAPAPAPAPVPCGDGHVVTLPAARVGQAYARGLGVRGGTPPYAARETSGSLQALGLSFAADGQLAGAPVAEGTVLLCVLARDASGSQAAPQAYRLTVLPRAASR